MTVKIKKDLTKFIKIYHTLSIIHPLTLLIPLIYPSIMLIMPHIQVTFIGLLFLINILAIYYKLNKVGDSESTMYIDHIIRTIKRCLIAIVSVNIIALLYLFIRMTQKDNPMNYNEMAILYVLSIAPIFLSYLYFFMQMIRAAYRFNKNKTI